MEVGSLHSLVTDTATILCSLRSSSGTSGKLVYYPYTPGDRCLAPCSWLREEPKGGYEADTGARQSLHGGSTEEGAG